MVGGWAGVLQDKGAAVGQADGEGGFVALSGCVARHTVGRPGSGVARHVSKSAWDSCEQDWAWDKCT